MHAWYAWALAASILLAGCGGILEPKYEYEEELYLALDGSVTVYVHASIPALVALRGASFDVRPRARLNREAVRALFQWPGVEVASVTTSRRDGRRFVHVRIDAADVRQLAKVAPLGWSTYRFERGNGLFEYHQVVGAPNVRPVGDVGWTGKEIVSFRLHLPSQIPFHNSPSRIERGNILTWEQTLTARLQGVPLDLQVHMETDSILSQTLVLFVSTIFAAACAFVLVVWWIARKGRASELAESRP